MTLPIRPLRYEERESHSGRVTVRRVPPAALLQLSRGEGVDVEVGMPLIERVVESEPRQTTPSVVRMRARRRWLATVCALVIVASGVGAAKILASADAVVTDR
jgi:hypothetical protein